MQFATLSSRVSFSFLYIIKTLLLAYSFEHYIRTILVLESCACGISKLRTKKGSPDKGIELDSEI